MPLFLTEVNDVQQRSLPRFLFFCAHPMRPIAKAFVKLLGSFDWPLALAFGIKCLLQLNDPLMIGGVT